MSTQTKMRNRFSLLIERVLNNGAELPRLSKSQPAALTLADLAALPTQSQLLVAHCLTRDNNDLTLLKTDHDAAKLLSLGWLAKLPLLTIGAMRFKIKPVFWNQLKPLRQEFLTVPMLRQLAIYRLHKRGIYPWIW